MMVRDDKAWLFKEVDARNLGWGCARATFSFITKRTGIALVASASKQTTLAGSAESFNPYDHEQTLLRLGEGFTENAGNQNKGRQRIPG